MGCIQMDFNNLESLKHSSSKYLSNRLKVYYLSKLKDFHLRSVADNKIFGMQWLYPKPCSVFI